MLVVIFDFDDTLFPTTHCTKEDGVLCVQTELAEHILDVISMLDMYSPRYYIITNAQRGWITSCLENFLPGCENLREKMELISTVDDGFSDDDNIKQWKIEAFEQRVSHHFQDGEVHHLLCFGDSDHDRLAAIHMKEKHPSIYVKNIKLHCQPCDQGLIEQHKAIKKVLDTVINHEDHVDIMINLEPIESTESVENIENIE